MRLLGLALIRLAVEPDGDEQQPASSRNADASDPWIGATDDETARPLVVSEMANSNSTLLKDVAEEGTLVVDEEVEDAVLIRQGESGGEDGAVGSARGGLQCQAVER